MCFYMYLPIFFMNESLNTFEYDIKYLCECLPIANWPDRPKIPVSNKKTGLSF